MDAPATSDIAPATANTVTAFVRLFRSEACLACAIVKDLTSIWPRLLPFEGVSPFDNHGPKAAFRNCTGCCADPTSEAERSHCAAGSVRWLVGKGLTERGNEANSTDRAGRSPINGRGRVCHGSKWSSHRRISASAVEPQSLLRATRLCAWNALLCSGLSGTTLRLQTLAPLVVVVSPRAGPLKRIRRPKLKRTPAEGSNLRPGRANLSGTLTAR
jgi:hypothetical protein